MRTLALLMLVGSSAAAQTGSSSITGTITDASNAAIPDVLVTVKDAESGVAFKIATNEAGVFRVASLPPGTYALEAEKSGFDRVVRSSLVLAISQVLPIDLVLQV